MGFKKLSEQELAENITSADELIAIINGSLKKINVETLVSLLNENFDVEVSANSPTEYRLSVKIGDKTVETPNLIKNSVVGAEIIEGHLILSMSDGSTIDLGVVISNSPQYGVCYDEITKSPTLTRVADSVGLVAGIGVGDKSVVNDFDNIYPWSEIRRCTLADDGTVTSYEGEPNYVEDGSIGQVMVEIPKFYIKRVTDESNHKIYTYICKSKLAGYRLSEAFKDRNDNEMSHIYIGAFPSYPEQYDGVANSVFNSKVLGGRDNKYESIMQQALSRGNGWHNIDVRELLDVLQPLFEVEFATHDSTSIFSGVSNFNGYSNFELDELSMDGDKKNSFNVYTEYTNAYIGQHIRIKVSPEDTDYVAEGFDYEDETYATKYAIRKVTNVVVDEVNELCEVTFSGSPLLFDEYIEVNDVIFNGSAYNIKASSGIAYEGVEGSIPFKWRGLENPFNNCFTWIGGILYNSECEYFKFNPDLSKQDSIALEEFEETDIKIPETGYISKLATSSNYPYLPFPIETQGASDNCYCDNFTYFNNGRPTVKVALRWGKNGVFGLSSNSSNIANASGRLAYCRY